MLYYYTILLSGRVVFCFNVQYIYLSTNLSRKGFNEMALITNAAAVCGIGLYSRTVNL